MTTEKQVQQRDKTLDIAKGLCIILMVIGHSGCPAYLHDFIYMFHMPCFFFISGWLLSDKYLSDLKRGMYQKAKGSYWPFVKWTLIFLFLHNVFTAIHVYDTYYTLPLFASKLFHTFTLTGSEQLLGGFWFLISLFWASVGALLFLWMLNKINRLTVLSISGGVILLIAISTQWHYISYRLPHMFREQALLATTFYLSGYLCKKLSVKFKPLYMLFALIPALVACCCRLAMGDVNEWIVALYYVIAMCGIFAVFGLSKWLSIKEAVSSRIAYIGTTTLYILTFHFLAFKIVSVFYLYANGLPIDGLAEFPVLKESNMWLWILYSIFGVIVPILIWNVQKIVIRVLLHR